MKLCKIPRKNLKRTGQGTTRWREKRDPQKKLVEALAYVAHKNKAIDIGAGSLKDSRYLLEQGFEVTAIDSSPLLEQEAKSLTSTEFTAITTSFEEFNFPQKMNMILPPQCSRYRSQTQPTLILFLIGLKSH